MTPAELRAKRKAMGLTQQALADHLGMSRRMVIHWEHGTYRVPVWLPLAIKGLASDR